MPNPISIHERFFFIDAQLGLLLIFILYNSKLMHNTKQQKKKQDNEVSSPFRAYQLKASHTIFLLYDATLEISSFYYGEIK